MITKTDYVTFRSCPRAYYYQLHDPKQAKPTDEVAQKRIDEGKLVGNYAHLYFDNTVKVKDSPDVVDIANQVAITKKLLPTSKYIAEASFQFDDLFCAVDILAKNGNGYDIYEVKASTDAYKHLDDYAPDVAFQKYVLELCGLEIKNCYILHLNPDYIRSGEIDIKHMLVPYQLNGLHEELKKPHKVEDYFQQELELVPSTIMQMRQISKLPTYGACSKNCDFYQFCHANLPQPNVLNLSKMWASKAHAMIENGIISFQNVLDNQERLSEFKVKLTPYQMIQMKTHLNQDKKPYINKDLIHHFFQSLKFPVYHIDFETMNEAIPPFDGVGCYQQIPFQYSLHIQDKPCGKTIHKEFLASKLDNEYELAKQLCQDIPLNVMSMSFNMTFEKSVLKHLATRFPDLAQHLMNIHDHMVDLLIPFRDCCFYSIKQNGSNSIKQVMPAICPASAQAYHNLKQVHNGGEALTLFPKMLKMNDKAKAEARKNMLAYCKQDTQSMVDILNALWKLVKE